MSAKVLEHTLQLARHFLHAGRRHDLDADGHGLDLDFDLLVVELALAQHLAELLARVVAGVGNERIENPLLGRIFGPKSDFRHGLFARHLDRGVHEIADDAVDFATDVADLGKLGRLHLDERRPGEAREATRDFGLADAGRTDHEDVLGRDFAA